MSEEEWMSSTRCLHWVQWVPAFFVLVVATCCGQAPESKPTVSDHPLSADELAVYRSVLGGWMDNGKGKHTIYLSVQTIPFHLEEMDANCGKALHMTEGSVGQVHRFRAEDLPALRSGAMKADTIQLVDPDAQAKEVEKNDPETGIRNGKSIEESVANGFAHGMVTLGEIHFDQDHTHAIVWYGFTCGSLCGNGARVILEKKNGSWGFHQACSHWIS